MIGELLCPVIVFNRFASFCEIKNTYKAAYLIEYVVAAA